MNPWIQLLPGKWREENCTERIKESKWGTSWKPMQIKHAQNTNHFAYSHSRLARNLVLVDNGKSKLKKLTKDLWEIDALGRISPTNACLISHSCYKVLSASQWWCI